MHACHIHAPLIKYVQDAENTCGFSSLDSGLFAANEHVAEHAVCRNFHHLYHIAQLVILIVSIFPVIF